MSQLSNFLARCARVSATIVEQSKLVIGATTYDCVYDTRDQGGSMAAGGFDNGDDFANVLVRRELLGTLPARGDLVTLDGVPMRVERVRFGDVFIGLTLVSPTRTIRE